MDQIPLQLERYFFPHQEVRANPDYHSDGRPEGSGFQTKVTISPIENCPGAFAIEAEIVLDESVSGNQPYFFKIIVFGIFHVAGELPREIAQQILASSGVNLLVGAARERLAEMTSRGPWGPFFLSPIPTLPWQIQILGQAGN
jgi:preprotein translocase subunit SecB